MRTLTAYETELNITLDDVQALYVKEDMCDDYTFEQFVDEFKFTRCPVCNEVTIRDAAWYCPTCDFCYEEGLKDDDEPLYNRCTLGEAKVNWARYKKENNL